MISISWPFAFGNGADYLVAFWTMVMAGATLILALGFPLSILLAARQERKDQQTRDEHEKDRKRAEELQKEERKISHEMREEERQRAKEEREEERARIKQDREDEQKREELRITKDFRVEERDKFYAQLDSMYLDIQKMIIQYPHLGKKDIDRCEDEIIQYNAFAFLMWNFIESIHDYCPDQDDLYETWHCVLEVEAQNFAEWFLVEDNRRKFKKKFVDYIDRTVPLGRG